MEAQCQQLVGPQVFGVCTRVPATGETWRVYVYMSVHMSMCSIISKCQATLVLSRIMGLRTTYGVSLPLGCVVLKPCLRVGNWSSCRFSPATAETRGLSCVLVSSMGLDPVCVFACA